MPGARMPMTAGTRFRITYHDGSSHETTVGIGDLSRMGDKFGRGWAREIDPDAVIDLALYMAWLSSRHDDTRPAVDFETFRDTCAEIDPIADGSELAPFDAAPPNDSPPNWHLPPAATVPTPADGSTPIPVTP